MVCSQSQQLKHGGQVLIVNSPTGLDTSRIFSALEGHVPSKVLDKSTSYLPGVDFEQGPAVHGVDRTGALAKSALYLAQNGSVPVLDLRDASHNHLAEIQQALGKNASVPMTTMLMYAPLRRLLSDSKGNVPALIKGLQDYGHMYRGSYEPTWNSIDHLTRSEFDTVFNKMKAHASEDDKASLRIVKNFLSPLLGLDVQKEVHIEPRFPVYDAVLHLARDGANKIAKDMVTHLKAGEETRRLSALHRLDGSNLLRVPMCTHCEQELCRSEPHLSAAPNGRLHSSMPACGSCMDLSRIQLVGTDLAQNAAGTNDALAQLLKTAKGGEMQVGAADSQRLRQILSQLGVKATGGSEDEAAPLTEAEKGKHWHDILRYNEVFQKSTKNSNARSESLMDQLLYHRIRSLELNLHTKKGTLFWAQAAPVHDWWMSHDTMRGWYESNQFDTLSQVLHQLKAFSKLVPNHEVITLFINVNDDFGGTMPKRGHRPDDLDGLLKKHLGEKNIYTPQHLKGTEMSIQKGAKKGWPALSQLTGKFIPVIVEGANYYADAQDLAESRLCFVAQKDVAHKDMIHRHNWNVFFDQGTSFDSLSRDINTAGFVSRQWVEAQWAHQQAIRKRAHHIATKSVNYHHNSWSKTHTPHGFPFLPFLHGHKGFDSASATEPHHVITFRASTGDLWGTNDNAVFASHQDNTPDGQWVEYQWYLSNANSHMQKWARAGIAFRQSKNDEGAAYFSVIRPAQHNLPAQVQLRNEADAKTVAAVARIASANHFKARCRYNHGMTECEGFYSEDGTNWRLIRSTSIHGRLQHHGLIASTKSSGHNSDGTQYQFLFGNVTKNGQKMMAKDFPMVHDMGLVYTVPKITDGLGDEAEEF